ncbi:MAG: histidinol-phosphate transaminase [Ahniella sp.]|nr:histidinol-phosphate transaminase [Ahniella sp.]
MSGLFLDRAAKPIQKLVAYDPGHDLPRLRERFGDIIVELGSNENGWGTSPMAVEAVTRAVRDSFRYPDPLGLGLRAKLAERHDCSEEEIVLGNGSHELLMQLAQVFAEPGDEVIYSRYGFAVYPIATRAVGATGVAVDPFPRDHGMPLGTNLANIPAAINERTKIIFVANPNNPTGTHFRIEDLRAMMRAVPGHIPVVVDEAYTEFADAPGLESAITLRAEFPNLVVSRTFSKAYGLAGLRVGYLVAHRDVCELINRLRESFNVNTLGLVAAEAALDDVEFLARVRAGVLTQRARIAEAASALGWFVFPSQTNFLLIDFGRKAQTFEDALFERAVIVRPMVGYGLANCLRMTVGNPEETDRLITALQEVRDAA